MIYFLTHLFDTSDWVPRRLCGDWPASMMLLHQIGNGLIFLCFIVIPVGLWLTRTIPPRPGLALRVSFMAFIIAAGLTHLDEIIVFYWPAYRLFGLITAICAVLSLVTVMLYLREAGVIVAERKRRV